MVSELSDICDGYIARKYNEVSDFGKIFDPMADSIARTSVLLTFTQPPVNLPLPLIFVFLYRDSVISTLRTICALRGFALAARMSGKIKAVIQGLCAFAVLVLMLLQAIGEISLLEMQQTSMYIVSAAAIYTLFSGADYIYANRRYISKILPDKHAKHAV
jgi:CDP-diacylglycerol--glycerol-3-phosphate 3-phosphatidyltransferase